MTCEGGGVTQNHYTVKYNDGRGKQEHTTIFSLCFVHYSIIIRFSLRKFKHSLVFIVFRAVKLLDSNSTFGFGLQENALMGRETKAGMENSDHDESRDTWSYTLF